MWSSQPLLCNDRRKLLSSCWVRGTQVGTTIVVFLPPPGTKEVVLLGNNMFFPLLSSSLCQFLLPSSTPYKSRLNLPSKPPPEPGDVLTPRVPERVCCCGNEEILSPPDSNKTRLAPDFQLQTPPPRPGANPPLCRASTVAGLIATPGCFPRC